MALDFQSRLTDEQREILTDFANEELAKSDAKQKRLKFLQKKTEALRDKLDALQDEDLKFVSSTKNLEAPESSPNQVQKKTLQAFEDQTKRVEAGVNRAARKGVRHFTLPSVSANVDDVKTPLLEAIKGRFERLEYAIRRSADRSEVLGRRVDKQDRISDEIPRALSNIQVSNE